MWCSLSCNVDRQAAEVIMQSDAKQCAICKTDHNQEQLRPSWALSVVSRKLVEVLSTSIEHALKAVVMVQDPDCMQQG